MPGQAKDLRDAFIKWESDQPQEDDSPSVAAGSTDLTLKKLLNEFTEMQKRQNGRSYHQQGVRDGLQLAIFRIKVELGYTPRQ